MLTVSEGKPMTIIMRSVAIDQHDAGAAAESLISSSANSKQGDEGSRGKTLNGFL